MLLCTAGAVPRLGKIEDGTTALDYEPEEIKRRGSTQPGLAAFLYNKNRHFLLDIPGDSSFNGDLPILLTAVDAVVFVVDAVDGVKPLTKKLWGEVAKRGLPVLFCINKMDRDRADFDMAQPDEPTTVSSRNHRLDTSTSRSRAVAPTMAIDGGQKPPGVGRVRPAARAAGEGQGLGNNGIRGRSRFRIQVRPFGQQLPDHHVLGEPQIELVHTAVFTTFRPEPVMPEIRIKMKLQRVLHNRPPG